MLSLLIELERPYSEYISEVSDVHIYWWAPGKPVTAFLFEDELVSNEWRKETTTVDGLQRWLDENYGHIDTPHSA